MKSQAITFPSGLTTQYYFRATHDDLLDLVPPSTTIVIMDDTVRSLYSDRFKDYRVLSFPAGESYKSLETIGALTQSLVKAGAQRDTMLLGVGGGVVTDITGYLASSFMRGVPFAFVPTTLLAQVDASIGGKNGVNVGLHKNMLGTIRQPRFILFDTSYLASLPSDQWSNAFAEVIKYGYVSDVRVLTTLLSTDVSYFQKHPEKLNELIGGCVDIKNKIVHADESESGMRFLLNFGHTAGHALETLYGLPHGHAVGLGMRIAIRISQQHTGLNAGADQQLLQILKRFDLPVELDFQEEQVMELLMADKKRNEGGVRYVLLEKPGVAVTKVLGPEEIRPALSVIGKPAGNRQ